MIGTWFLRGLRRGVVTTGYPRGKPDAWTATLPTPPRFDPDTLTGPLVDELVDRCPSGALARDHDVLIFDVGACTGCGRCLTPGVAEPSGVWELSATRRADLVKRIPIRGGHR
jgi:ferredoxin